MRTRGLSRPAAALPVVVALVGGCVGIGATDREDFQDTMRERGGGFVAELPQAAVDAVAEELGEADFELRAMDLDPATETVRLQVRDPAVPGNLDDYVVHEGEIDAVEPVRVSGDEDLDLLTFPVSSLALDQVEEMVDSALAELQFRDGYVSAMSVGSDGEGGAEILVVVDAPRASGRVTFNGAGELVEARRL